MDTSRPSLLPTLTPTRTPTPVEKLYQYTLNMNPFAPQNPPRRFVEDKNLFRNVAMFRGQRNRTLFATLTDVWRLLAARTSGLNVIRNVKNV